MKVTEEENGFCWKRLKRGSRGNVTRRMKCRCRMRMTFQKGKGFGSGLEEIFFWILSVIIGLFLLWCLFTFLIYGGYIPLPTHNFEKIYEKSSASYFQDNYM